MKLYAFLILASYALHARAATLPALDVKDVQKKLASVAEEVTKKDVVPSENTPSEQELVDQANTVNEVENNLRVIPKITDIPVKVVVEDVKPSLKVDENKDDTVETDKTSDVKRVEIDLNNPGAPQRQQHETQNPENYEESINIKKVVEDTQSSLKQGFENIGQGFENIQQITVIQQNLQSFADMFMSQLTKLNETMTNFLSGGGSAAVPTTRQKEGIEDVQLSIRTLENNFQNAVKSISNEVKAYATQRGDNESGSGSSGSGTPGSGSSGSGSPGTGTTDNNFILQAIQNMQNLLVQGFTNIQSTIQSSLNFPATSANNTGPTNIFTSIGDGIQNAITGGGQQATAAPGAQSDEGSATPSRPGWPLWQGIQNSLNNIFNPGQNQAAAQSSPPAQPGPIAQAIQSNPIVQGVVNFMQPNQGAQQPATAQEVKPSESNQQEGSNDVPVEPAVPNPENTEEKVPEVTDGPIKKIIQNSPIIKGISGAVQKLQSFSNPEKPRDTIEVVKDEKDEKDQKNSSDVKGLIGGFPIHGLHGGHGHHHHGPHGPHGSYGGPQGSFGTNINIAPGTQYGATRNGDIGSVKNAEPAKEEAPEKTEQAEEQKEVQKEETKPQLPEATVKTE